jgi:voltage-gated sodium channel
MKANIYKKIADSSWFQYLIILSILMAGVIVGIETYGERVSSWLPLLHALDYAILLIFTVEAIIKIAAEGNQPFNYFKDPWNLFDFIIVLVCWLSVFLPNINAGFVAVFRLARILRVLRLITALPQLKMLVDAMLKSIPSMGYVSILLFLLFYIYGVLGVFMFGENNPIHFGDLQTSLITLFQITTLEGWADIMYINVFGCDHPQWGSEDCTNPVANGVGAIIYFISFVLIGTMIVLNLFIGVIMNSMEEVAVEQKLEDMAKASNKGQIPSLHHDIDRLQLQLKEMQEQLQFIGHRIERNDEVERRGS